MNIIVLKIMYLKIMWQINMNFGGYYQLEMILLKKKIDVSKYMMMFCWPESLNFLKHISIRLSIPSLITELKLPWSKKIKTFDMKDSSK